MNKKNKIFPKRTRLLLLLFTIAQVTILVRATMIHIYPPAPDTLKKIAQHQYQRTIEVFSPRGTIYDRRNTPLAMTLQTPSIAVNPRIFSPTKAEAKALSRILNISVKQRFLGKKNNKKRYFAWLKRKISYSQAEAIKKLDLKGLFQLYEPLRAYPQGSLASNLVGYTGTDNTGLLGLELQYDKLLGAPKSQLIMTRDAKGRPLFLKGDKANPEKFAKNMVLTIDTAIQEITEKALSRAINKADAKRGFAIVTEPHTGKILALANHPTFDPNQKPFILANSRNNAVSDLYEPGSVTKPFILAKALEQGLVHKDSLLNCENGALKVDRRNSIHDDHPHEFLTAQETIAKSSNICIYKVAQMLGPKGTSSALKDFGLANSNKFLALPGISSGKISSHLKWKPIRFANISFGQGFLTTGLEISMAYGVIANGGKLMQPLLVERIESEGGEIIQDFKAKVIHNS